MGLMTTTVHSRFPFFPLSFLDSPFLFLVSFFSTLFESHANAGTLEWDRELSFPPSLRWVVSSVGRTVAIVSS